MKTFVDSGLPRCYILDEKFKVKLATRGGPHDPLNAFYTPDSPIDALPANIEGVVRCLTAAWGQSAEDAAMVVDSLAISVTPLHGPAGRHIGVFVRHAA